MSCTAAALGAGGRRSARGVELEEVGFGLFELGAGNEGGEGKWGDQRNPIQRGRECGCVVRRSGR
jgi:hypothetical protein